MIVAFDLAAEARRFAERRTDAVRVGRLDLARWYARIVATVEEAERRSRLDASAPNE